MQDRLYRSYVSETALTADDFSFMKELIRGFWNRPGISVLLVVSDPDEIWISKSVSSVLRGIYPHVELCICDNGSERPHVRETLEEFVASDWRVRVRRLQEPVGYAEALNEALSLATGRFVTVLGEGDELAPEALFGVADLLQDVEADVIYGDEDSVDISDRRMDPAFKPHWSPDLLLSTMYVGRPCVIRKTIVKDLGGFRAGLEAAEEHDLMLRVSERTDRIHHLRGVLYHRRVYETGPIIAEHGGVQEGPRRAVSEALERRAVKAAVEPGIAPGSIRVVRDVPGRPTVSVVALLAAPSLVGNARALEQESTYPVHELIPVGIGEHVVPGSVNEASAAKAANLAAGNATGEYLLFIHNYMKPSSPELIAGLLREAQRPEAGVVGGRILNGNGTVRYAGSFLDLSRLTGSLPGALGQEKPPRFLPVVDEPFNPLAVTAGCMMIRRSTFEEAEGFDEDKLPTDFYDLDLSFRLREKGLLNIYTPEASLVSMRSLRSLPDAEEIAYMWQRWWPVLVKALHYKDSPLYAKETDPGDELLPLISV